jgi:hypothetical protein
MWKSGIPALPQRITEAYNILDVQWPLGVEGLAKGLDEAVIVDGKRESLDNFSSMCPDRRERHLRLGEVERGTLVGD